jgi:hypothetical protein
MPYVQAVAETIVCSDEFDLGMASECLQHLTCGESGTVSPSTKM